MANNMNVRRHVVQVSETPVGPAVQSLCIVGNDVCAVTQQDIRKVVDFRMFTLSPCLEGGATTILLDLFVQEPREEVKLANNPYERREVLKVSKTPMAPAVHIPIVVGSEQYVVIQQDIRKEVDIRMFTYSRLGSVTATTAVPLNVFGGPVMNLQPCFPQALKVPHVSIDPCNLHIEIPKKPVNDVALGRSKSQLCYSAGTSTEGLMKNNGSQHCPKREECLSSCQTQTSPPSRDAKLQTNVACQTQPATRCHGCNTSSSLQLVKGEEVEEEECEDEESHPCHPCTDREFLVQEGPILRNCPQEEPCTSRLMDMEDQRRCDCIRSRIYAQRLAELERQKQQDYDTTPQPPPPKEWLSDFEERKHRQRNNR
ncbi:uncharacterized protein Mst89B [Drosophila kikkawai]|uniref:Uncharacterized protein Mst89B n=1 Tax=Drosophila kikkawai TaxID=30033 RepID=A0A6P4J8I5_DROKI|nr:uncharacterized protein LOC108085627 [Drosophila kikkawai]